MDADLADRSRKTAGRHGQAPRRRPVIDSKERTMPRFNESSALLLKTAVDSGITSPTELANLMGNAAVETGHFRRMHENLGYTSADSVIAAVSSADDRFTRKQVEDAVASRDPQRIATVMYENRADLGNTEPGDGWRFHGRGYLQYTDRDNYERYGQRFNVDLAKNPDLAAEPQTAANLAVAYWRDRVPENLRDNARAAGRIINGGDNGANERVQAANQWAQTITPELVADIQSGKVSLQQLASMGGDERNQQTRALQEQLAELGYHGADGKPLKPDGDFGRNTRHALKEFQRAHGLDDDAVVGRDTRTALAEAKRSPLVSEATHADHPFFNALRERMPRATDAQVAHTLQAAKAEGIQGPQQLQAVTVQDKVAFVAGNTPGFRTRVDLDQAPTLQESTRQVDAQNQQRDQALQQPAPQQEPAQARGGMAH
ncbi:peptidoglycan-binding protein [uncultured Xanthomonas sp.]|uniref:peptidoglycan-binding protein n=1 Tax=uncultured Xanthomonas sp. TaxID=152831 RepID=UPI0025F8B369|nr:peptidoglycan-binding protein [uncultured Xanthomonas sp.]